MKRKILTVIIFTLAIILFLQKKAFLDSVLSIYSSQDASNIGAYYDELWEAKSFYILKPTSTSPSQRTFHYEYTNNLGGNTSTYPQSGEKDPDDHNVAGATIPADAVVVEWRASGHLHFTSGM